MHVTDCVLRTTMNQKTGESINEYVKDLRLLASLCVAGSCESKINEIEEKEFFIGVVGENKNKNINKDWRVKLRTNGTEIRYKLDTGAQANVLPSEILRGLDLIVDGKNKEEHDERLKKVLQRAWERNVKFNKSKRKVTFLGHEIKSLGVKLDYNKIKIIKELKPPENKEAVLQRILGVVNYVGKFLPCVAQINAPLRKLIKKDI
ncbi:hypothetical protein QTP88_008778 [Uroleucon formosanum]